MDVVDGINCDGIEGHTGLVTSLDTFEPIVLIINTSLRETKTGNAAGRALPNESLQMTQLSENINDKNEINALQYALYTTAWVGGQNTQVLVDTGVPTVSLLQERVYGIKLCQGKVVIFPQ